MDLRTTDDQTIIEENTAYVLGMYDLYPNDQDIVQALYAKGIKSSLIPIILHNVKVPGYQKRVRQAKRMIWIGAGLTLLFTALYLFFKNLPGANTLLIDRRVGSALLVWTLKFYRELFYLLFFFAIVQFLAGIASYKKYTKLLEKHQNSYA